MIVGVCLLHSIKQNLRLERGRKDWLCLVNSNEASAGRREGSSSLRVVDSV